jgi:hypothetical protein
MGSRRSQILSTEWTLHFSVVRRLLQVHPSPVVDLFATRFNRQLPQFVSPCPDPLAWRVDAFSFPWDDLQAYAFPPFPLIRETLRRVGASSARILLIAPAWPNQAWYSTLLYLLAGQPLSLPLWRHLLRQPQTPVWHQRPDYLDLHAWPLSGLESDRQDFRIRWLHSQQLLNETPPAGSMRLIGSLSVRGVPDVIPIHSAPLFPS